MIMKPEACFVKGFTKIALDGLNEKAFILVEGKTLQIWFGRVHIASFEQQHLDYTSNFYRKISALK